VSTHRKSPASWPLVLGTGSYYLFLRPQMLKWGTRLGESQRRLPGDELIPKPNVQMTHAANIDAPPEALWPWIAQMGRERSGYYGLDILTNQSIPSVAFIRQDMPAPEKDTALDGGYHIIDVIPCRQLLIGGFSIQRLPGVVQDVSSLYLLERRRDGSTRLLVRHRVFSYGLPGALFNVFYEMVYFMFASQQIEQLKQHAQSVRHL
jgi:hypothetical protein